MGEQAISISFPLDDDGFLRRACPGCERELKWLQTDGEDSVAVDNYHCPYCGLVAPADQWFTESQIEHIRSSVLGEVVGPALDDLDETLRALSRTTRGLISGSFQRPERQHAPPIFEPNDMLRVDFECHPTEPVKVLDAWGEPVHCLICGNTCGNRRA